MDPHDRRDFMCSCLAAFVVQPVWVETWAHLPIYEAATNRTDMTSDTIKKPLIARIWRGRVRRERAAEYQKYNYEFGIKPLIAMAMGVQGVSRGPRDRN
jgi:hypothetical protein